MNTALQPKQTFRWTHRWTLTKVEQLLKIRWNMFKNRKDAGEKLAKALEKYKTENPLILAIPRGGVEVGLQVARILNVDFSLIIAEIDRRIKALSEGNSLPYMKGRTVILIDDGIAIGSTMRAAIKLCKNRKTRKIVVALPVAGRKVAEEIVNKVDELVVLEIPRYFRAVAESYEKWYDVTDEEVLDLLREQVYEEKAERS
jgi:putative phosphoribosyl transferase